MLNGLVVERDAIFSEEGESDQFYNALPSEQRLLASVSPDNLKNREFKDDEDQIESANKSDDADECNEEQALVFGSTDEITN